MTLWPFKTGTSGSCKTPPFDKRRCYQLYWDRMQSWSSSSKACQATGQRLPSIENGRLLQFINDNIWWEKDNEMCTRCGSPDYLLSALSVDGGDSHQWHCFFFFQTGIIASGSVCKEQLMVSQTCGPTEGTLSQTCIPALFSTSAGQVLTTANCVLLLIEMHKAPSPTQSALSTTTGSAKLWKVIIQYSSCVCFVFSVFLYYWLTLFLYFSCFPSSFLLSF